MIQKAKEDKNVKGLLLRINSPGGTVSSSQEIYQAMLDFRESGKKIVVSVADICASGAYYISLPADAIIVNPGSLIGSIGVIMNSIEFSELMQKWGISSTTVKSGKYKDIFSSMRKPLADEKTMLQEMIDSTYNQFLDALLQGRKGKCPEAKLRAMADGRIYNGVQAVKNGLADGVGDYSAAKKIIAELCGLDYKNLNIIRYRQDRWQDIVESLNLRPVFGLLNSSPVPQYRYNGIH
ncbi:MAG TPA: signal peptide peptidase SppA [Spirochaetia bacterium]|nr:signal peptide peptidase SppA [Spirochaetia bacterium]